MEINNHLALREAGEQASLADVVHDFEETCKSCHPLTPLKCLTDCGVWKLKSEFRVLGEKMNGSGFMTRLLNTLKNKRRLQVLDTISRGKYSLERLQQELKKSGYYHSQQTIAEEYLHPLVEAGLAEMNRNLYSTTLFGCRLNNLVRNYHEMEDVFPPHSECYEEKALGMLFSSAKTYEDFENAIPTKSVARVLNRLQKTGLIETTKENDYIFFFRTKRDSDMERLSPTERRAYENIPMDGISAGKLAAKTGISVRRTYKYVRRLKGKKLVFVRRIHKSYKLTAAGFKMASMLQDLYMLYMEALTAVSNAVNGKLNAGLLATSGSITSK
jgi:predicted transcriptional regulator